MASDEQVVSRTRSQTTASEPVATRTRQALGSSPEMSAFADVKDDKTLNEWLHEIAFVTSTMSDPDEPQSFKEAWWDPDLISREKWREAIHLEFKKMLDMGVWMLKNPYSRFGLISSCADQFNSWCCPRLRCLFTCIFHNL